MDDAPIVQIRQRRLEPPCEVQWANVTLTDEGPEVSFGGCDADGLEVLAKALTDYARALRIGDDPTEIVRHEWRRRGLKRAARVAHRASVDLAYRLDTPAVRATYGIPPASSTGA